MGSDAGGVAAPPVAPARAAATVAGTPWPLGLRVLFVVCCLSILTGGAQMASAVTVARGWVGTSAPQMAYWVATWLLAVAAVVAGALGGRKSFGILCLAGAALNVIVACYYNFQLVRGIGPDPLIGHARLWTEWGPPGVLYVWNCAAIAFNAAVCFYLLRWELPRWKNPEAPAPGFSVAARE